MTHPLEGTHAVVIGGSRGIGAAIALRLASDGAFVTFTYAQAAERADELVAQIHAAGGQARAVAADSANPAALEAAIQWAAAEHGGRIHRLVHNAGVLIAGPIASYSVDDFDRMFAINVRGVFVAVRAALPFMPSGSRVVVIGSNTRGSGGLPGVPPEAAVAATIYGTTKAAVARMVRGLARELGPRGITINCVEPGPTITDMNPSDGPHAELLRAVLPVGRMAPPSEIADFVAYLVRPEVGYITGASLTIDGGLSA